MSIYPVKPVPDFQGQIAEKVIQPRYLINSQPMTDIIPFQLHYGNSTLNYTKANQISIA